MRPAFPTSDYYEGSAPPRGPQPTASLPAPRGQPRDGSHVHRRPIDGGGAQLFPCSLATSTPQTFLMASAPATKFRRRSRPPRAGVHCSSAHIRQVGADAALEGVQPLVRSRYTFPSRLPDPSRLAVPARPVVVGAAPTRALRFQDRAAPSFNDPLRRAAVGSLIPLGHSTPRGALRAHGTSGPSRRGGHRECRARSPPDVTAYPPRSLPRRPPVPEPATLRRAPDAPAEAAVEEQFHAWRMPFPGHDALR
jgi:hypothetical protein